MGTAERPLSVLSPAATIVVNPISTIVFNSAATIVLNPSSTTIGRSSYAGRTVTVVAEIATIPAVMHADMLSPWGTEMFSVLVIVAV